MAERDSAISGIAATVAAAPSDAADVLDRAVVADRYEVLGLVGSGAMGTVYRARDRELDEIVALKVLKKELAGAHEIIERFRREVKLARRVTHRNVARMFDIGEEGGDRFMTMELIEGESLGSKLAREGRVAVTEVVTIARDICAGLGAAHDAGVLHRDLKPDNVIVARDGRAVITDFGIARAALERGSRTAPGAFIGTPLYMAPEQVEGLPIDGRADLYSLGAMLYELLTGKAAWERESIIATAAARLLSPPPDARAIVPEIPEPLAALVTKLMARQREDRPATPHDVGDALATFHAPTLAPARVTLPPVRRRKKRIAVLPITVSAADDEYLAFGVGEELRDLLSVVDGVAVRHADKAAAERANDPREAGRMLDVDAVVAGTLRRDGDQMRVALRVITVEDGFQLWARRFERAKTDVLAVADEAARDIAAALTTTMETAPRAPNANRDAEDLYLRGRFLLYNGAFVSGTELTATALGQAYALEPNDPRIAGHLAIALARGYSAGRLDDPEEARRVALHALDLDATRAEGRVALGTIHLADGDGQKAAVELASALRVARNSVDALDAMGRVLCEVGETTEGLRLLDQLLAKEEVTMARITKVRTLALLGEMERADEVMRDGWHLPETHPPMALTLLRFACWTRDVARVRAIVHLADRMPEVRPMFEAIGRALDEPNGGFPAKALHHAAVTVIKRLPTKTVRSRAFVHQLTTEASLVFDDVEGALTALRACDEAKLFDILWLDRCPLFERVRDDPTFREVRAHAGERAAAIVASYERARLNTRVRATRPT